MVKEKKIRRQLTAEAEPALIQEIGHELVRRDISLRQAMDEAFRVWLAHSRDSLVGTKVLEHVDQMPRDQPAKYTTGGDGDWLVSAICDGRHRGLHKRLAYILWAGIDVYVTAINSNLEAFAKATQLERQEGFDLDSEEYPINSEGSTRSGGETAARARTARHGARIPRQKRKAG